MTVTATFRNKGHYMATNAVAHIASSSPYVSFASNNYTVGTLEVGEQVECTFNVNVASGCPESEQLPFTFTLNADGGMVAEGSVVLKNTIIATAANPEEGGTLSGAGKYVPGSTCTITATANDGYVFVRWTLNGNVVSGLSTYSFTVTSDAEYVAEFEWVTQGIAIGDAAMSDGYLPSYSFYNYTLSQQIYTTDEIGTACEIASIAFFNAGSQKTRSYTIYMTHTDKSTFENANDWINVTEEDMVYSGSVTMMANRWTTVFFDTPFYYNGTSNLALIVDDNTGSWSSGMSCRVFGTSGSQAIRIYSDNTNYDPYNPSGYNGTLMSVKNQIILGIPYTITASANPAEYGTVSGAGHYAYGAPCTLTAIPNDGYYFVNWTEDGTVVSYDINYSFTVSGDRNLVANFVEEGAMCRVYFDLHDSFGDGWNGNYLVVDFGDGHSEQFTITSGSSASYYRLLETGSNITLTWIAGSWINECSFDIRFENDVPIYHGANLSASFQHELTIDCENAYTPVSISVAANLEEAGIVAGGGVYEPGTVVNLKATPYVGYRFVNWTKNGTMVSTNRAYSFTVTEDGDFVANFAELSQSLQVVAQYYPDATNSNSQYVKVSWASSASSALDSGTSSDRSTYCIYRAFCDGSGQQMIAENVTGNQYIDTEWATLPPGNYAYGVSLMDGKGQVSEIHWNNSVATDDNQIINLSDYVSPLANLSNPDEPSRVNFEDGWFYYDNGTISTNVGMLSGTMYWGIMIPAANLLPNAGNNLTKVALYTTYSGATTLSIYLGGDTAPAGDPVVVQDFDMLGNRSFMEIDLNDPIPIDGTQNLWITFFNQTTSFPAATCGNMGEPNGSWLSSTGSYWSTSSSYTWMIRAFVEDGGNAISWSNRIGKPIVLNEGWNWFSTYIEVDDPVAMLDMLKAGLGNNATEIQSFNNNTEFDGEEWFGGLDDIGISNEQMYMILVDSDCTVELSGIPANPANHEIAINPGWNWIGFPCAMELNVSDALTNFQAEEEDMIQISESMIEFDGEEWFGDFETLVPGQGYMYYSNSTESKTLIISTGAKMHRAYPNSGKLPKQVKKAKPTDGN